MIVEILVQRGRLVLRPAVYPRCGWEEQFAAMAKQGDDTLLDDLCWLLRSSALNYGRISIFERIF
jgi:hypothetical protein